MHDQKPTTAAVSFLSVSSSRDFLLVFNVCFFWFFFQRIWHQWWKKSGLFSCVYQRVRKRAQVNAGVFFSWLSETRMLKSWGKKKPQNKIRKCCFWLFAQKNLCCNFVHTLCSHAKWKLFVFIQKYHDCFSSSPWRKTFGIFFSSKCILTQNSIHLPRVIFFFFFFLQCLVSGDWETQPVSSRFISPGVIRDDTLFPDQELVWILSRWHFWWFLPVYHVIKTRKTKAQGIPVLDAPVLRCRKVTQAAAEGKAAPAGCLRDRRWSGNQASTQNQRCWHIVWDKSPSPIPPPGLNYNPLKLFCVEDPGKPPKPSAKPKNFFLQICQDWLNSANIWIPSANRNLRTGQQMRKNCLFVFQCMRQKQTFKKNLNNPTTKPVGHCGRLHRIQEPDIQDNNWKSETFFWLPFCSKSTSVLQIKLIWLGFRCRMWFYTKFILVTTQRIHCQGNILLAAISL